MTVKVRTADLRGYAALLKRNAEHNDAVLAYMRQWCGTEMQAVNAEGLLAKALNFHDRIFADAEHLITQLGRALRGSAAELEKVAKAYDSSDQRAMARLEMEHYNKVWTRESWEASHTGFADYMNPLDVLKGTPSYTEYNDPTKILDKIGDTISVSGAVVNYIQELTGVNPLEKFAEFFSGNWQAYSKAAGAWRNIGEALERIGKNIDRGLASLDHAWDGGASEAAYETFQVLANVFKDMLPRFSTIERVYKDFARFAMLTASVIVDIIKITIDTALVLLARRKGTPLLGEAAAAFESLKIIKYIGYLGWTMVSARATVATIFGAAAGVGKSPLRYLGIQGYDPAAV
ncbi:hypothetical protein [Micromonospora sp. HM5-17]|uniref:hypothetical protein n=1 Tax=Micromonospora sp. HM5-17 TaxID=2487710 RepID=UPI000F4A4884|nr:hypothetical protein [Micromonospora sp. HM5-17]ROT29346.1 hypothetical protein EF879_20410 [Micromonospora sp. HM5-17]